VAINNPAEEAAFALDYGTPREQLSRDAQAEYDRIKQERYFASTHKPPQQQREFQPPVRPVPAAQTVIPKNAALYCLLGVLVPGLPSILIRKEKVVPIIQLALIPVGILLSIVFIGFFVWIGDAIWGAITGYQDAQQWNAEHGFVG
jgi:hypothetical protein